MHGRVEQCFVSLAKRCVIDTLKPNGRTAIFNESLEEIKQKYPDAIQMDFDAAIKTLQDALVSKNITEIKKDEFIEALNVLPPSQWVRNIQTESFKSPERLSGSITAIYVRIGKKYYYFNDYFYIKHDALVAKVLESIKRNTQ